MRLQKFLAQRGIGSRRFCDACVLEGKVTINGVTARAGDCVNAGDSVRIGTSVLKVREADFQSKPLQLLKLHKPTGSICTKKDPQNRLSVFSLLPSTDSWVMIGRLDLNTSGLLLFCNQGKFAHQCMHPSFGLERVYEVKLSKPLSDSAISMIRQGVMLDDGMASITAITPMHQKPKWYRMHLHQGKNRVIRRLYEALGYHVVKLRRTQYGGIKLAHLPMGDCAMLTRQEINRIKQQLLS